jgi:hypothetical protein
VEETLEEGFPTDLEEREAYFMSQISQGEEMSSNGKEDIRLSMSKAEADSMIIQVQTRSLRRYAFTKASKSTRNQKLLLASTIILCRKIFSRSWHQWSHRTRVSRLVGLEVVVVTDLALRAAMALNKPQAGQDVELRENGGH